MPLEDDPKESQPPSEQAANDDGSPEGASQSGNDPLDSSGEGEVLRKRQRQHSPSPSPVFHGGLSGLQASPHRHKTFEELITTAGLVKNMALAHEIVVDGNFKLSPRELPENTIVKQVHDVMHKAFWDSLSAQLADDPPSYGHAVTLIGEIREILLSLLLPHHDKLKTTILEAMDLDLIRQEAEHSALDVSRLASFVVSVMSKLCAPVRDEEIAKLGTLTDPVELFREIFRVLDLMKVDMANFTLQSLRPHLQQQSVEYERKKFQEFLQTQQDGLLYTRQWLEQTAESLQARVNEQQELRRRQNQEWQTASTSSPEGATSSSPGSGPMISPGTILNHAYVSLLYRNPDDALSYPETVLMDQGRFHEMGSQARKLVLVGSVLLVTYTNTGSLLAGIQGFPSQLKHNLFVLLDGVRDFAAAINNVAEQACKEVNECLKEHGFAEFEPLRMEAMKSQICALANKENHIYSILDSRLQGYLVSAITAPSRFDPAANIPPGLTTMQSQLVDIAKAFIRLVVHNRSVFGPFYAEILSKMVQPQLSS
ncbi:T-complex protein 11-like protein 1 [Diadema antillarum]|uniref:T-complex protein 11-like protein 1 n=1 Tax=Diadema antillarum TaxID=105358 RepID=UPI003A88DFF1